MRNYGIWMSGGITAKVVAESSYLAVKKFLQSQQIDRTPLHCCGSTLSQPLVYTSGNGDTIKVWQSAVDEV